jgi:hypothetical protein
MALAPIRLACLATLLAAAALPCSAESFASSASSAGSASSGSVSDSLGDSSDSSSPDKKVAQGDYRVAGIAPVDGRPGVVRLTLTPTEARAGATDFFLMLPEQALGTQGLAEGAVVSARHRPYGLEFARAQTREAFFLVLTNDWHSELDPRPVTL